MQTHESIEQALLGKLDILRQHLKTNPDPELAEVLFCLDGVLWNHQRLEHDWAKLAQLYCIAASCLEKANAEIDRLQRLVVSQGDTLVQLDAELRACQAQLDATVIEDIDVGTHAEIQSSMTVPPIGNRPEY